MKVYRITREKYARDLSGEGARLYGGRWNSRGNAMLYTSGHASLAALEVLVHTPVQLLPNDLVLIRLFISEEVAISTIGKGELPPDWQSYPSPEHLKQIGDKWLADLKSPVLCVPSAIIPEELNWLLNPVYRNLLSVEIEDIRPFTFDERLFD